MAWLLIIIPLLAAVAGFLPWSRPFRARLLLPVALLLAGVLPLGNGQVPAGGGIALAAAGGSALFVPASLSTLFTGFILLITRRKALTQVVGYLVLENGIYLFGLLLVEEMPLLVETGILLDLFVGIFIMGIVINHITAAFDSMDTRHLAELKD